MSLANSRRSLESDLLSEINNIDSLVASELTAADVIPKLPRGKYIKLMKSVSGICDGCNRWDSDLHEGMCDWCNSKYGVNA